MGVFRASVCLAVLAIPVADSLRLQRSASRRSFVFDDPAPPAAEAAEAAAIPAPAEGASVVYGIMTNNRPEYQAKLQAQLDTWAAEPLASKRFIAVTGVGENLPGDMDQ